MANIAAERIGIGIAEHLAEQIYPYGQEGATMSASISETVASTSRSAVALVISDSAEVRSEMKELLEAENVVVFAASSPGEAALAANLSTPDIIIADHEMPQADGLQVVAALKQSDPTLREVPVALLTSRPPTPPMLRQQLRWCKIKWILPKPGAMWPRPNEMAQRTFFLTPRDVHLKREPAECQWPLQIRPLVAALIK